MKTAKRLPFVSILALLLAFTLLAAGCDRPEAPETTAPATDPTTLPTETTAPAETGPLHFWETGYIAGLTTEASYFDEAGALLGTFPRGTLVQYEITLEGDCIILLEDTIVYLQDGVNIVTDAADIIPAHTLYVRTGVNLLDADGRLLETFAEKGSAVEVTGYDCLTEDGAVHMYRVNLGETEGYIRPWYLTGNEADALANFDNGTYAKHAGRENRYGGGGAADLDYFPREKGPIPGNEMPEECRTLYLVCWQLDEVDKYIAIAKDSGINAFVVDIVDGGAIGYAGEVMAAYCPSAVDAANNTVEEYRAGIQKLKDAGYYVIGRITTFNDTYFVREHPEYAIANTEGKPLKLAGAYWPSAFVREVWQYKVDLAVEAAELMGFNEIQFDYVRFPDNTGKYERAGTIDFRNSLGESKAQAVQRFLMYATDTLHEHGVYVSADVYGESAYAYVTAYGQYWAAISNVVDVISGMPYPDHFAASGDWLPWEHPYETLYDWGECVAYRQAETSTPAAVRTWIQAYNAIREPYPTYGVEQVSAQIRALRDTGCTGGFMTWNSGASLDKYKLLLPAFEPPALS